MSEIKSLPLVDLQKMSKYYQRGEQRFAALDNVNLQLFANELTAIIGASGSGKSTLMNIIGLLDRATQGDYLLDGVNVSSLSDIELAAIRNKKIGFIFQSFCLLPRQTVLQNVMLPLLYNAQPVDREESKILAMDMLNQMRVGHLAQQKPNQLSGGQQQRVAIARALVNDPSLILADEPTGALDSATTEDVMQLFKKLHHDKGCTIVIITHEAAISKQCERIVKMNDGKLSF